MIEQIDESDLRSLEAEAASFQASEPDYSEPNEQDQPGGNTLNDKPTSEIIYPVLSIGSRLIAPNWGITEEENLVLSEAFGDLLDKYIPNAADHFSVEITALIAVGMVAYPRIMDGIPMRNEPEPIEGEATRKPDDSEPAQPQKEGENPDLDMLKELEEMKAEGGVH